MTRQILARFTLNFNIRRSNMLRAALGALLGGLLVFLVAVLPVLSHEAHDPHLQWYKSQEMNESARQRLQTQFKSCCDAGDHFRTRFRLLNDGSKYGAETYEYLSGLGKWTVVPPDIIKRAKTPDGKPVLFIHRSSGKELCFIIDDEGI